MMQQLKSALATAAVPSHENKRTSTSSNADNTRSEKRRDVRATPGKKLFTEKMDHRDSEQYLSALEAKNAHTSPMKCLRKQQTRPSERQTQHFGLSRIHLLSILRHRISRSIHYLPSKSSGILYDEATLHKQRSTKRRQPL